MALTCEKCGRKKLKTTETRETFSGVRRRKECLYCGHRMTTIERTYKEWERRKKPVADEVKKFRSQGLTYKEIAKLLECSVSHAWQLGEGIK